MSEIINDGNVKVTYVPSIANKSAPTTTELSSGTDLECIITPDGLQPNVNEESVSVAKLCEIINAEKPGRYSYQWALTMYRYDTEAEDIGWTTMQRGTEGFLVLRFGTSASTAYAAGDRVQVYPGSCGVRRPQQPEANSPNLFQTTWFAGSEPDIDAVVASGV